MNYSHTVTEHEHDKIQNTHTESGRTATHNENIVQTKAMQKGFFSNIPAKGKRNKKEQKQHVENVKEREEREEQAAAVGDTKNQKARNNLLTTS